MSHGRTARGPNWNDEEDRKLLDMVSAILKRSQQSIRARARTLKRRAKESEKMGAEKMARAWTDDEVRDLRQLAIEKVGVGAE